MSGDHRNRNSRFLPDHYGTGTYVPGFFGPTSSFILPEHHEAAEPRQSSEEPANRNSLYANQFNQSAPDLGQFRRNSSPPPPLPPLPHHDNNTHHQNDHHEYRQNNTHQDPLFGYHDGRPVALQEEQRRPESPHRVVERPHHNDNNALHVPPSDQAQGGRDSPTSEGGGPSPVSPTTSEGHIDWEREEANLTRSDSRWYRDDVRRRAARQREERLGHQQDQGGASHHLAPLEEEHPPLPPPPGLLQPPLAPHTHRSDTNPHSRYAHPQHGGFYGEQHPGAQYGQPDPRHHGGYPQQHGGQHGHQHAQQNHWAPVQRNPAMPEGQIASPHQPVPRDRLRDRLFSHRVFNLRRNQAQPAQHGQQHVQHQNTTAFSEPPHSTQQKTRRRFWHGR